MRAENLSRLSDINISKFDAYYLHYKYLHRDLSAAIKKYAAGNVLDIGCGNKPYEKMFEGKIEKYTGCDIIQSNLNKVDILCEANKIPIEDAAFETVFSTQTIEHVADHQGLVNEAYRLLKPGGHFIVSGPFTWPLHEEPYDYFRFTKHGFRHIIEKAGFEVVEINSNGGIWVATATSIIHAFSLTSSKNFFIRSARFIFFKLRLCWLVNTFFGWLERVDSNTRNTLNYVVIAKK
jgi:SAM-dependent methyltransferase